MRIAIYHDHRNNGDAGGSTTLKKNRDNLINAIYIPAYILASNIIIPALIINIGMIVLYNGPESYKACLAIYF